MEYNRTRQGWFAGLLAAWLLAMPVSAAQSASAPAPVKEAATTTNSHPRETSAAKRPVYGIMESNETYEPKGDGVTGVFMRLHCLHRML